MWVTGFGPTAAVSAVTFSVSQWTSHHKSSLQDSPSATLKKSNPTFYEPLPGSESPIWRNANSPLRVSFKLKRIKSLLQIHVFNALIEKDKICLSSAAIEQISLCPPYQSWTTPQSMRGRSFFSCITLLWLNCQFNHFMVKRGEQRGVF